MEVARSSPALVGPGGFVSSFIQLGAAAVVAPLWSVEDDVAHEIAVEFYNRREVQTNLLAAAALVGGPYWIKLGAEILMFRTICIRRIVCIKTVFARQTQNSSGFHFGQNLYTS